MWLYEQLKNETYKHGGYTEFYVTEPKVRRIQKSRYIDTLNMLLDMDILIHSSFFIGTYTSNVSRIVPLYVGFDKSFSLDDEWKL